MFSGFRFQVSGFRWLERAKQAFEPLLIRVIALLSLCAVLPTWADFEEQRDAMTGTMTTQSEEAVVGLLRSGLAEGKAAPAISEVRKWLSQNRPEDGMLFYYAALAADQSGDWKDAVSLYQQFLADADLTSSEADDAVFAMYSMLIEGLKDANTTYNFGKNEGHRLVVVPRARQFDQWFLNEARKRNDVASVAKRLSACLKAGYPDALMVAHYEGHFRWLLLQLSSKPLRDAPQVNQSLLDTLKEPVQSITFSEELKLKIDWHASVLYYNQAKLRGEDASPPLREARALLAVYPGYADKVQMDWLGGYRDLHANHVGDLNKYWPHEVDAKMGVVIESIARMDDLQKADFFRSWKPHYFSHRQNFKPHLEDVKAVRGYLDANPEVMNSRSGPLLLGKDWWGISIEEAKNLAPHLAGNSHPDASPILAIAAVGEKDYDKIMQQMLSNEIWRFWSERDIRESADRMWHFCGRPGGNVWKQKASQTFKDETSGDPDADSPVKERVDAFKRLWADYQSSAPKLPKNYGRAKRILSFSPELVPALLKTDNVDTQRLLRSVLAEGMRDAEGDLERVRHAKGLNPNRYDPWIQRVANHLTGGNLEELKKRRPGFYAPHDLDPVLRQTIAEKLNNNRLRSWQVMTWLNVQHPDEKTPDIELLNKLQSSSIWENMPFEVKYGVRQWFGKAAMQDAEANWIDAADVNLVCKELKALSETSDVASTANALQSAIAGAKQSPIRFQLAGMDNLGKVSLDIFKDSSVLPLIVEVLDGLRYRSMSKRQKMGDRLYKMLEQPQDPVFVQNIGSYIAHYGARGDRGGVYRHRLIPIIESLLDSEPASASLLARNAVTIVTKAKNLSGFTPVKRVPELRALSAKADMRLGLVTIPVARTAPSYPVYRAQADWLIGNEDQAWNSLNEHWEELFPVHRKLSVDFLMWALQRAIYSRDEFKQEELIKALQVWAGEENTELSKESQVEIMLAYGDIAVQKGMLREAHEIFKRTENKSEYDGVMVKHEATLRKALVQRLAKDFDGALSTLNELALEKIPELWSPIHYAMAEVYYDMEEYTDANDQVTAILAREPEHAEAKIMQGRLQLKQKRLMEATEVELGTISSKQTLVPGEKLKVTLTDPTLAVSGAGTEIEVVVWAESGDRELLFLRQFGDEKTKFRGAVATALGAPVPDDNVLQVIGDDQIYYAYSDRFRQKMNNMDEKRGGPIGVASDALLMASGRRLLTEAEQRIADMQAQMNTIKRKRTAEPVKSAMAAIIGRQMLAGEEIDGAVTKVDVQNRLKPGNPLHVRVIDLDRSRTAEMDEVAVSISTSSGDSISRFVLKETGTHTGWFEGQVPTAGAQALAFAENSAPGRNPNMVISPRADYPAWSPVPGTGKTPLFTIDLNDNVPLGQMTILAEETGSKLQSFVLETGMDDSNLKTIAIFPENKIQFEKPYHPNVTILNDTDHHHQRNERSVYDLREIEQHLERGWISQQYAAGVAENVKGPSEAMTNSIPEQVKWKRNNRHNHSHVIYRFQGYFYEPGTVTRRFKVDLGKWTPPEVHPSVSDPAQYLLAVNGRIISERREKPPKAGDPVLLTGQIKLGPGLHRFEIWSTGWNCRIGFGRTVHVFANLGEDPLQLVSCPDTYFDPARFPEDVVPHVNPPASIQANDDGTRFTVGFAPNSRTRLLRLMFINQQGPVPVINKITLARPDGEQVLPVKEDYATLNKNETLEMVTGDTVAVRYQDDRYVDKDAQNHERFLDVAFSNAEMMFQFFEMRKKRASPPQPYFERQLRFAHGQPVFLTVSDPDMDVSAGLDSVQISLKSSGGNDKTLTLMEDEDVPGTFRTEVLPVAGAAAAENEISVPSDGRLVAVYRDMENTNPGVPTDRLARLDHAEFEDPVLRISHSIVKPFDFKALQYPIEARELVPGFELGGLPVTLAETPVGLIGADQQKATSSLGSVMPRWQIINRIGDVRRAPKGGFHGVHGQRMYFEVEAPHMALRVGSTVSLYVQTEAGRNASGRVESTDQFDITVPGTMKLEGPLALQRPNYREWRKTPEIPIYIGGNRPESFKRDTRLRVVNTGVFIFSVPLIAGVLPENGALNLTREERHRRGIPEQHGLVVRPNETVYIGFRYTDDTGVEQWITGEANVITHPVLDVLEDDYRREKSHAYIGENLYLRVVDLGGDVTDGSDTVEIKMQAKSGAKLSVTLLEVDNHSGIFKATLPLTYARRGGVPEDYDVLREGFPVVYGDLVGAVYVDANGQKAPIKTIRIRKGADGRITPFSKQYEDQEMAMRSQFALAEAYLEMATHHRKRGEEKEARREYDQARRLLASVIDQFTDPDTRSHAEFLLGNLTQEEADATDPGELQQKRYRAALARFMRVTGSYPDTRHASMAQFKIATVYEKLGEPDIAAQEYVKLAYKYPQSEFLALSMARLGTHFLLKASGYEQQAKVLLAKTDNKDAVFEGEAMQKMAVAEYLNAGRIFSRMLERFPSHELAGKCGLRAGQAYMRGDATRQALNTFLQVVDNESYDGPDIRSQAMYWAGMCYETMREPMAAYAIYKRLTFDFPESSWAAYARSQLSQERMLKLDTKLEMERLEEEGQ